MGRQEKGGAAQASRRRQRGPAHSPLPPSGRATRPASGRERGAHRGRIIRPCLPVPRGAPTCTALSLSARTIDTPARRAYRSRSPCVTALQPHRLTLLITKENTMLKRLTLKLFTLFVLCAALTAVSSPPASSTNRGVFCMDAPMEYGCNTDRVCCYDWGYCWCA